MSKLKAEFTSYMKIALKNDCIDYFRMQNRKDTLKESSIYGIEEIKVSMSCYSYIDTFSFDKLNISEISDKRLYIVMKELTNRQKEIICLYADGFTAIEIAKYLDISVGTVKASISKIRKKINKIMKG